MKTHNFEDIREAFIQRAHDAIWCAACTITTDERPRARVLHPIWEGQIGWVLTFRNSLKGKDLAHNPHMALTYMKDPAKPLYIDCKAEWVDDLPGKQHAWDLFVSTPPPLGYPMDVPASDPNCGVLRFTPWRIELSTLGGEAIIWRAESSQEVVR